jgi:hypothetical protein
LKNEERTEEIRTLRQVVQSCLPKKREERKEGKTEVLSS